MSVFGSFQGNHICIDEDSIIIKVDLNEPSPGCAKWWWLLEQKAIVGIFLRRVAPSLTLKALQRQQAKGICA
jgi:hypothetical protein